MDRQGENQGKGDVVAALLSPWRLGRLKLANRFVMAPMTRGRCPDGLPGDDVVDYYARRASGAVGLIISEGMYIDHPSAGTRASVPRLESRAHVEKWRRVVAAVHHHHTPILAQLWHLGAERHVDAPPHLEGDVLSPSGITLTGEQRGRAATRADIEELVAAYVRSARLAIDAGFDGVEIHAAHGFLLDQFLWETTNRRTDAYGGSHAARARLSSEVVAAVAAELGSDVPISFRFSQWKVDQYDARISDSPNELAALLRPIAEAGVTVFHASARRHWEPAFDASPLTLSSWTRRITGVPTISVGSVGLAGPPDAVSLASLQNQYDKGDLDLVALGRALVTNPDWVADLARRRINQLRAYDPSHLQTLT